MPRVNLCEEGFRVTESNFANLPRAPKLPGRDENIQQIVYNLINGTVAAGTNVQWGIYDDSRGGAAAAASVSASNDTDDKLIGTEDSEFFKILNIIEEKPGNDAGTYRVTYVFIQGNTPDLLSDDQLLELNAVQRLLSTHPEMRKIRGLLSETRHKMSDASISGYEFSALDFFIQLFDNMREQQFPLKFGSLLLFCENCQDDVMTMACQVGSVLTHYIRPRPDITMICEIIEEKQELSEVNAGKLIRLLTGNSDHRDYEPWHQRPQPTQSEEDVQAIIDYIQDWKSRNPELKFLNGQISRYFQPFVDIPHIDWVGNVEVAFEKSNSYKSLKDIKNQLKENPDLRLVVRNSSCTLAMSLTMMQLRRTGYQIIDLYNAGKTSGCVCYSNAASVNDMISIFGSSIPGLMELLYDETPQYQFHVFNRNDCIGKSEYAYGGNMYFIDIPSAVCLFTKQKERLRAMTEVDEREEHNDDVDEREAHDDVDEREEHNDADERKAHDDVDKRFDDDEERDEENESDDEESDDVEEIDDDEESDDVEKIDDDEERDTEERDEDDEERDEENESNDEESDAEEIDDAEESDDENEKTIQEQQERVIPREIELWDGRRNMGYIGYIGDSNYIGDNNNSEAQRRRLDESEPDVDRESASENENAARREHRRLSRRRIF